MQQQQQQRRVQQPWTTCWPWKGHCKPLALSLSFRVALTKEEEEEEEEGQVAASTEDLVDVICPRPWVIPFSWSATAMLLQGKGRR